MTSYTLVYPSVASYTLVYPSIALYILAYDNRADNPVQDYLQGPKILKSESESAVKQMSKGKGVIVDNISAEALQALGDFGIEILTELCNDM